jgi:hypothetical protein
MRFLALFSEQALDQRYVVGLSSLLTDAFEFAPGIKLGSTFDVKHRRTGTGGVPGGALFVKSIQTQQILVARLPRERLHTLGRCFEFFWL